MGYTYDIVPGVSVGQFVLGDSLWHILDVLRTQKVQYPKVEISWDIENPVKSAVTVALPHLTLFFPASAHQILTLISIRDIPTSALTLAYESTILHSATTVAAEPSSPSTALTRGRVGKVLGPTFAGSSADKLSYPGIAFELQGQGGRDDPVKALSVTSRSEDTTPLSRLRGCTITRGQGVTLDLGDSVEVLLGSTTAQDLLLDLGPPLRKFYKEDNRMERMWGAATVLNEEPCFWNYFQHGLDFLIDSEGIVIKIMCHTNIPGTPLFQRYARCPWRMSTNSGDLDYTSTLNSFRTCVGGEKPIEDQSYTTEVTLSVPTAQAQGGGNKKKKGRGLSPASIASTNGSTEKLSETLAKPQRKSNGPANGDHEGAMTLDRGVEGGLDGVIGLGPSRLAGYDGVIVEEDIDSGGITSVLVFAAAT